ncbi:hypothetical protein PoB_005020400 [Plakobranchus ocellatus]|uniref:Uncharacterized protein n=1 Tax=Plakobranchus ocellatus TaxID=259542 RepID=A0AAV4BZ81_9GAST|nr:hypothetical protein PoB_005020400 [Plakobranchus ocellatus]
MPEISCEYVQTDVFCVMQATADTEVQSGPQPQNEDINDDLLALARKRLLNPRPIPKEDAFDYFGKTMAHKLRDLPTGTGKFCKELCSDIMFEAALGRLFINSTILTRRVHEPEDTRPFVVSGHSQSQHNDFDNYQSYGYN